MMNMLLPFMTDFMEMQDRNNEWGDKIIEKWKQSKNMPRKMKKRVRKELILDYSIQQYGKKMFESF